MVLVVIPTYNEKDNLPDLVRAVLAHEGTRVMVVDDQSPDGTGQLADALAVEFPGRVEVMHRTGQRGLGRSYVDGLRRALQSDATLICQMDGDWSHDPQYLPAMIAACGTQRRRHRIAISARRLGGELATAPHHPERVRQPLHPRHHGIATDGLHERLSLLAP